MRLQTIPPVVAVVLCVLAVGVSASTLESSVQTDPDEVIDIDWSKLPISTQQAQFIKEEIKGNTPRSADQRSPQGRAKARVEPTVTQDNAFAPDDRLEQQETSAGPTDRPNLLALLQALLLWLAVVVALVLLHRYGHRLRRFLMGKGPGIARGLPEDEWPSNSPDNEIDQAWVDLVRHLDLDHPWSRTPAEVAVAAARAELDTSAVETLIELFEEVHYGEVPPTESRKRRARAAWVTISQRGGKTA